MSLSKSARYYRRNAKARAKKDAYNKEFNRKPEQRKKRSRLWVLRRRMKRNGANLNGKDLGHKRNGNIVPTGRKANRGRKDKNGVNSDK